MVFVVYVSCNCRTMHTKCARECCDSSGHSNRLCVSHSLSVFVCVCVRFSFLLYYFIFFCMLCWICIVWICWCTFVWCCCIAWFHVLFLCIVLSSSIYCSRWSSWQAVLLLVTLFNWCGAKSLHYSILLVFATSFLFFFFFGCYFCWLSEQCLLFKSLDFCLHRIWTKYTSLDIMLKVC